MHLHIVVAPAEVRYAACRTLGYRLCGAKCCGSFGVYSLPIWHRIGLVYGCLPPQLQYGLVTSRPLCVFSQVGWQRKGLWVFFPPVLQNMAIHRSLYAF